MYYSILSSDQRHVADHFQLGLYRQVEALACLVHCNGPDKHHSFFQDLLTLKTFPSDVIVSEFIRFSNASNGGLVMSLGKAIRHRAHWLKPYLKAEMLYGLRVLLSIIEDANSGVLSKTNAVKKLKGVKFAGDLTINHLFAVAVQRGLIVPREFLTTPIVAETLCNAVRKKVFHGDKEMNNDRIRKATEMATEKIGLNMLGGEHALCESVRAEKKTPTPGTDVYFKAQDFVWISSDHHGDNGIISELRYGSKRAILRPEDKDRNAFHELHREDSNPVRHQWWIPEPDRMECLSHFVKECLASNCNPLEVLHPSANARDGAKKDEERELWKKYVTTPSNKINVDSLPREVRQLHKASSSSTKKISKVLPGRVKRKAAITKEKSTTKRSKNVSGLSENLSGKHSAKRNTVATNDVSLLIPMRQSKRQIESPQGIQANMPQKGTPLLLLTSMLVTVQ
jgi:hypothetical protein